MHGVCRSRMRPSINIPLIYVVDFDQLVHQPPASGGPARLYQWDTRVGRGAYIPSQLPRFDTTRAHPWRCHGGPCTQARTQALYRGLIHRIMVSFGEDDGGHCQ